MIKDIDNYFDYGNWIFPKEIIVRNRYSTDSPIFIKNSKIKIKADFLDPGNTRFWGCDYFECWQKLGIVKDKKFYQINIETCNLLRVLQYSGFGDNGYLKGTYKLMRVPGKVTDVYRLIPEGSREEMLKTDLTNIYHNPRNFTTKWIPGHLYISKSGDLWLCVLNNIRYYCSSSFAISIVPESRKKILYPIIPKNKSLLDRYDIKDSEDLVKILFEIEGNHPHFMVRSENFSGKDVGTIIDSCNFDLINNFYDNPHIGKLQLGLFLIEELWKTDDRVKNELKKRIKSASSTFYASSYKQLSKDLGL